MVKRNNHHPSLFLGITMITLTILLPSSQSFNLPLSSLVHHHHPSTTTTTTTTKLHLSSSSSTPPPPPPPPPSPNTINRRDAALSLANLLLLGTTTLLPSPSSATLSTTNTPPRTIVITGCNSGIGLDAVSRLVTRGHTIIMACRSIEKARAAADSIEGGGGGRLIPAACDLSSLSSVRDFVKGLGGDVKVDALCLNAGLARDVKAKEVERTVEGFESTIGVNHLGHFYLHHLMMPLMKQNGRIVVTASSVHDPESPGGKQGSLATLGNLSGLERGPYFDMVDGGAFDADKAYKDSKLCNVLFTRELQRRLNEGTTGIKTNCFSPGLIVGTGLFRDQNPVFTKIFDVAATNILKVGESVHWGGGTLEYMTLDDDSVGTAPGGSFYTAAPGSGKYGDEAYGRKFAAAAVSKEAQDDAKAKRLWELSEQLVGIRA